MYHDTFEEVCNGSWKRMDNTLRRRKVLVDFEGAIHAFRLVENHTFGSLLIDAAKHWMIDDDDYELQDEEGSTWPCTGTPFV